MHKVHIIEYERRAYAVLLNVDADNVSDLFVFKVLETANIMQITIIARDVNGDFCKAVHNAAPLNLKQKNRLGGLKLTGAEFHRTSLKLIVAMRMSSPCVLVVRLFHSSPSTFSICTLPSSVQSM